MSFPGVRCVHLVYGTYSQLMYLTCRRWQLWSIVELKVKTLKTKPQNKTEKPNSKQTLLDFRTNLTPSLIFSLYYFTLSDHREKGVSKANVTYWNHSPKPDLQMFLHVCIGLLIALEIWLEISCYQWFLLWSNNNIF